MVIRYIILLFVAINFFGCGSNGSENNNSKKAVIISKKEVKKKELLIQKPKYPEFFYIEDIDRRRSKIDIYKEKVIFHKIRQHIVILNIFSTSCPPCRGMLPYLNDLQRKNRKDIFIIGIRVGETMSNKELRAFMKKYHLSFFISNYYTNENLANKIALSLNLPRDYKIPLTVIYKDGKYIIHLSGASPPEMIQNIIDQLK